MSRRHNPADAKTKNRPLSKQSASPDTSEPPLCIRATDGPVERPMVPWRRQSSRRWVRPNWQQRPGASDPAPLL